MIEQNRQSVDLLLAELRAAGATVKARNAIHCPFHEDKHASAGVYLDGQGVARFKCHGGSCGFLGDLYDVRAKASGRPLEDVLKEARNDRPISNPRQPDPAPAGYASVDAYKRVMGDALEQVYTYTNPVTGKPELHIFRIRTANGKRFCQATPNHEGIVLKAPPDPKPLYNRSRVSQVQQVVVVEGEKCVHELHKYGIVATTWPGGCKTVRKADWSPLAGKACILWPDNDDGGRQAMVEAATILEKLSPPATVRVVDIEDLHLPENGDVVDYAAALPERTGIKTAIELVLMDAGAVGPAKEVADLIEATIAGKRRAIEFPWRMVGDLTKALMPGMATVLCGDPGASKSFWLLQAFFHWHREGYRVALFELEDGRDYHLNRVLAQVAGNSNLFDAAWVEQHAEEARAAYGQHAEVLDSFGRCLFAAPDKQVKLPDLAAWIEERIKDGCEIVGIDPVTIAEPAEKPWVADLEFLVRVKTAIRRTGARLILVTHPKKGRKTAVGMDELAGGAAWPRFTHTVLWMEAHIPRKSVEIRSEFGNHEDTINRTLRIIKARNGRGHGLSLAYEFRGESLTFVELGGIARDVKQKKA